MEGGLSEVTTLWRYTNRSLLLLLLLLVFADAWYQHRIYPRDAMLARVGLLAMARCLCPCPFVCLSQVGVLLKRLDDSNW